MDRLKNKVAIVTGAAGGMGAAEARLFAAEGAKVMATDIQEEKLKAWVKEAQAEGLNIECLSHDVSIEDEWKEVVKKTLRHFGRIDILVNNAGIYPGFIDCEQTDTELWNKIIAINLTGPFLGCKTCIPHMKKHGGSIINISSVAGMVGGNGTAYSASKAGVRLLTKDIAVTFAKENIRANTVCPGAVLTPMTEKMLSLPEMQEKIKTLNPQGRVADPIEIAKTALFLASDESSYITGADIPVDGGTTAG